MFDRIVRVGILLGVLAVAAINGAGFFMSPFEIETTLRPLTDAELASMPPLPPDAPAPMPLIQPGTPFKINDFTEAADTFTIEVWGDGPVIRRLGDPVPLPEAPRDPPAPAKSMRVEFGSPDDLPEKVLTAIGRPYTGSLVLLHGDHVEINGREYTIAEGDDGLAWLRPGFPPGGLPPLPPEPKPHAPPTDDAVAAFRAVVSDTVANGASWSWCDFPPYWIVSFGPRTFHVRDAPAGWDVWELRIPGDQPQAGDRAPEELPLPPSDESDSSAMWQSTLPQFSFASFSKPADGSAADAYEAKRQQEAEFLKMQSGRYLLAPIDGTPMLCIFDQWSGTAFTFQGTGINRSRKVIETGWPKPVDSSEIDRLKQNRLSEFMKALHERNDAEKVEAESAP